MTIRTICIEVATDPEAKTAKAKASVRDQSAYSNDEIEVAANALLSLLPKERLERRDVQSNG